jgi:hypothetical protein
LLVLLNQTLDLGFELGEMASKLNQFCLLCLVEILEVTNTGTNNLWVEDCCSCTNETGTATEKTGTNETGTAAEKTGTNETATDNATVDDATNNTTVDDTTNNTTIQDS